MSKRTNLSSGSKWESLVGYSRAVRIGNVIEVTGTVADDKGQLIGGNDPYQQAHFALSKIKSSLEQLGASMEDVVRTRIYVTNISEQWEAVGKAHHAYFHDIMPCTSMVEIAALISPEYLVEIEATAVISSKD